MTALVKDRTSTGPSENKDVNAGQRNKQRREHVETPAFGTQRRGFFKDGAGMSRSRESSVDDMVAGGFTS
mgnify:CR=1 FL=1